MAQTIKISNGDTLSFPDEMTEDQIRSAIHKEYGAPTKSNSKPSSPSNPSLVDNMANSDVVKDILVGRGKMLQGLKNLPYNIVNTLEQSDPVMRYAEAQNGKPSFASHIPHSSENIAAQYGRQTPGLLGALTQGASQYAPYALTPGVASEKMAGMIGEGIPFLGKMMKAGVSQMPGGALFGATQSNDPLQGALQGAATNFVGGAVLNPVGRALGALFGTKTAKNDISSGILRYLQNQQGKFGALTPHDTAENLSANYMTNQGEQMPVDIGTLTNNGFLKKLYNVTSYIPGSGASRNMNQVAAQTGIRDIENAKQAEMQVQSEHQQAQNDFMAQKQGLQTQSQQGNSLATSIGDQLAKVTDQHENYGRALDEVPNAIDLLAHSVPDKTKMTSVLKNGVKDIYDTNKKVATEKYDQFNNSKVELNKLDPNFKYPNYRSAANDIIAQKENLINLFGSDTDLGSRVLSEINKAEDFLQNGDTHAAKVQDVIQRVKNLGKLESAAKGQGSWNEGRILGELRKGLESDVHNLLDTNGHEDLSKSLKEANDWYKTKVVPFWKTPQIRKSVTDKNYIPKTDSLAKELYDPNNHNILFQLPKGTQDSALFQHITGGKGNVQGLSTQSAEDVARKYKAFPVDTKTAIQQHNPQASTFLEKLSDVLTHHENLSETRKALESQLETVQKQSNRFEDKAENLKEPTSVRLERAAKALQDAKNIRYGVENKASPLGDKVIGLAKGLGVVGAAGLGIGNPLTTAAISAPIAILARQLSKALSNPELINAYTKGEKLPQLNESLVSALLKKSVPALINPLVSQGAQ